MSKRSASNTETVRTLGASALGALAALALAALTFAPGADQALADEALRVRTALGGLALSPRILPVDLNDRAERNLGTRIDDRSAFLDLFRLVGEGHLAGALDFLFLGTKDPVVDGALAQALEGTPDLVLAVVPVPAALSRFSGQALDPEDARQLRQRLWHPRIEGSALDLPEASTFLMPFPALTSRARYLAHIGVTPDPDGLYRRIPLFYRWEDGLVPSLALALACVDLRVDPAAIVVRPGVSVDLPTASGDLVRIPVDRAGRAWIPFPGPWAQTWPRTPLDKVAAAAQDPEGFDDLIDQWSGGLVVAADLTTGKQDFGATPLEAVYPRSGLHTSLLNGILTDTFFRPLEPLGQGVVLALVAGASALGALCRRTWTFHLVFAGALGAFLLALAALWFGALVLPWASLPASTLAGAWLGALGDRLLRSRDEKLLLRHALGRYFPRALADRVLAEGRVDLVPRQRTLTILFADIAGFTRWSADKDPALVHGFLSDYLETMAALLFSHGATVDKFMGDGILAFFGDPEEQPDHADRALAAALELQARARTLAATWGPRAGIDLKVRVGLNSGPVIVGNLGSQTRIEYTVIGAAVNLAQRMEGGAPVGGILVSSFTRAQASPRFRFADPRPVTVKGYDLPVEASVLTGSEG